MLNRLKYKVTFKTPARTFEQDLSFEAGLTAITGPNGRGKSLILEMVQYALFGTKALRGTADDYEALEVDLEFILADIQYAVTRNGSKVLLSCENGPLATGTKPVNQAIQALFGYSMDVFQVANVANQGKIEELGNMKPTERRRLVDETIGLNTLDKLTEFIQKEINASSGAVKALEQVLVEPTEPEMPEGYVQSDTISEAVTKLQDQQRLRDVLQHVADKVLVKPEPVTQEHDYRQLGVYQDSEINRNTLVGQVATLQRQLDATKTGSNVVIEKHQRDAELPILKAQHSERLLLANQISTLATQAEGFTAPSYTEAELEAEEKAQALALRWHEKQALLLKTVEHVCPACEHVWDDVDPLLAQYANVPEEKPVQMALSKKVMKEQALMIAQQPKKLALETQIEELGQKLLALKDVSAEIREIEAARTAYAEAEEARTNAAKRLELQTHINNLKPVLAELKDHSADIKRIVDKDALYQKYLPHVEVYTTAKAEVDAAKENLKKFASDLDEQLDKTRLAYNLASNYESKVETYAIAKVKYDDNVVILKQYESDLTDWKAGKAAVTELRARVKGFLIPSLNTVATHLINEMTGGELSWLQVNEAFEIFVEGQRLETLSGAGKSVANLALRTALGQVLTNRVFSSCLLDEVDGAMDDNRAAYTAACLRKLTGTIKQLILVTHKPEVEADHYIRL